MATRCVWGMVQRSLAMLVGGGVLLAATACWPQFPPGPTLTETTLSPSPVVAGSTFTLTATATTTNGHVAGISLLAVRTPSGGALPRSASCPQVPEAIGPEAAERTARWSCEIPIDAPSGTWVAAIRLFDGGYGQTDVEVPIEVTGGSDDTHSPELSLSIPPTVARGTSFGLTVHATDDHGPVNLVNLAWIRLYSGLQEHWIDCTPGVWTEVDATAWDYTATCAVPADGIVGRYENVGAHFADRFGQGKLLDIETTVV